MVHREAIHEGVALQYVVDQIWLAHCRILLCLHFRTPGPFNHWPRCTALALRSPPGALHSAKTRLAAEHVHTVRRRHEHLPQQAALFGPMTTESAKRLMCQSIAPHPPQIQYPDDNQPLIHSYCRRTKNKAISVAGTSCAVTSAALCSCGISLAQQKQLFLHRMIREIEMRQCVCGWGGGGGGLTFLRGNPSECHERSASHSGQSSTGFSRMTSSPNRISSNSPNDKRRLQMACIGFDFACGWWTAL